MRGVLCPLLRPRFFFRPSSDAAITPPEPKDGGVARSGKVVIALGDWGLLTVRWVGHSDIALCCRQVWERRSEEGSKTERHRGLYHPNGEASAKLVCS